MQDWHRYNVKRRAAGHRPISEAAFEALVEDEQAEVRCRLVELPAPLRLLRQLGLPRLRPLAMSSSRMVPACHHTDADELASAACCAAAQVGSISGSESEDSEDEDERNSSSATAGPQFAFSGAGMCWLDVSLYSQNSTENRKEQPGAVCRLASKLSNAHFSPRRRSALCMLAAAGGPRPRPCGGSTANRRAMPCSAAHAARARRPLGCHHAARRPLCEYGICRGICMLRNLVAGQDQPRCAACTHCFALTPRHAAWLPPLCCHTGWCGVQCGPRSSSQPAAGRQV